MIHKAQSTELYFVAGREVLFQDQKQHINSKAMKEWNYQTGAIKNIDMTDVDDKLERVRF